MEEEWKKKLDAENISVLFKVLRRRVANKIRQPLVDVIDVILSRIQLIGNARIW